MSQLRIEAVDPFDEAGVEAWHAVYEAAEHADRGPGADVWHLEEQRQEMQEVSDRVRRRSWLARDGAATPVGAAWLALGLRDNTHLARCGIFVLPQRRRTGIGSALLDVVEAEARSDGRTVVTGYAYWPYALGPTGAGSVGVEFAGSRGFEVALPEVRRRLTLPRAVPPRPIEASGYDVRAFVGPIPDDLVDGWAVLDAELDLAAPTGDLALEPRAAAVSQVRETEALAAAQGRTLVNAVAVSAAGEVAAYTQLVVPAGEDLAYQWGTMVGAPHRGHRLGLAVKGAALELLQRVHPGARTISTYNAEANEHMIAINEELGFEPIERMGQLQKHL